MTDILVCLTDSQYRSCEKIVQVRAGRAKSLFHPSLPHIQLPFIHLQAERLMTGISVGTEPSGQGSLGRLFWPGRVGSRVNMTDPVSDRVFVVSARALLLLLEREFATLESVRLQS